MTKSDRPDPPEAPAGEATAERLQATKENDEQKARAGTLKPSPKDSFDPKPDFTLRDLVKGVARSGLKEPKHWRIIAAEVLWRKQLVLAATRELWDREVPHAFKLATVDVFVEKAQRQLTVRAHWFLFGGVLSAVLALGLMIWGWSHYGDLGRAPKLGSETAGAMSRAMTVARTGSSPAVAAPTTELPASSAPPTGTDVEHLILEVLRVSTFSAFFIGAVVFLVFLSRAALHEMVVIYQRRHALRFGRLAVYLRPELTTKELEQAFNWNAEYRSAFKDIRVDKVLQPVIGKLIEAVSKVTAEVASAAARKGPGGADKEEA